MSSLGAAYRKDKAAWDERIAALELLLAAKRRALRACGKARSAVPSAQELEAQARKRPDYVRGAIGGRFTGIFNPDAGVGFGGPWGPTEAELRSEGGISPAGPPPKEGGVGGPSAGGALGDFGSGAPSFGSGAPDFGSGAPNFGSGQPNFGPALPAWWGTGKPPSTSGAPDFGPGAPSFGSGAPDFGSGAPSFGSGAPDFGSGAPDFGPSVPPPPPPPDEGAS